MFKRFIKNEKGNIALAVVVALIASFSGFAVASIALEDSVASLKQFDSIQTMHLLRSELGRGQRYVATMTITEGNLPVPRRDIEVEAQDYKRTYITWGKATKGVESGAMNTKSSEQYIFAKVQAFKGTGRNHAFVHYDPKNVEAYKFGAKAIRKETFAGFMYLTNTDESVNGDEVRFWGRDTIYGRLHSNTDIQLQNQGGGWPTFHGLATTAGEFVAESGQIPYEDVFLGGYKENVGEIVFNPTAEEARRGNRSFSSQGSADIIMVKINGTTAECHIGYIRELPADTLYIYDSYPPYGPVGNQVSHNFLELPDTTWVGMNVGAPQNTSEFIEDAELWLCGEVSGAQTWGCSENIYLLNDITYSGTSPGLPPDGYNPDTQEYDYPVNDDDFLGVVSEEKVLIKYGWVDRWHPDTLRVHPNCGTVNEGGNGTGSNGIILYGAYCALGQGDRTQEDGEFGFEYHYPHLSTSNTTLGQEKFTHIDLHLCLFPPANPPYWAEIPSGFAYPQPAAVMPDYPWYNPLWPEGVVTGPALNGLPYRERGRIELYGAISQQRRGFVHRSGTDAMDQGRWELEEFMYGPLGCNPPAGSNAPGGTGGGIGYGKDYHYDNRFVSNPPPNFPEVHVKGGETPFKGIGIKVMGPNVHEGAVESAFNN